MEVKRFICTDCGEYAHEVKQKRGEVCFKCHIRGIRIGFTYGKEVFSGPTIGEIQRKTVADSAAKGITAEPIGTRWI